MKAALEHIPRLQLGTDAPQVLMEVDASLTCLAFHPERKQVIAAGTVSGGTAAAHAPCVIVYEAREAMVPVTVYKSLSCDGAFCVLCGSHSHSPFLASSRRRCVSVGSLPRGRVQAAHLQDQPRIPGKLGVPPPVPYP